jgi:hypothetical protein
VLDGLVQEDADAKHNSRHDLPALCGLAKNGTYVTLVKDGAQGNDGLMSLSGWIVRD